MHPELTEAIGALYPELEEAYYAFMNDVERSLQIRYSQEDAVWIAAAVLLYEKYYCNPGISSDDILLMQYEVQTRSQKYMDRMSMRTPSLRFVTPMNVDIALII